MHERAAGIDEWDLVGRADELLVVRSALRGEHPGVLLTGAPGTGKSRLAREAMDGLDPDLDVRRFVCTGATSQVPYAAARSLIGESAPPEGDPHHFLLDRLRSLGSRPVIFIDDIDRLDRRSMAVLHEGLADGLIRLLATTRAEHVADPDIVALWKDLGCVRSEIEPLDREDVAAMLRTGLGGEIDALAVKEFWRIAAGVPLFVRELARHAIVRDVLHSERNVWQLRGPLPTPSTLTELVAMRLDRLDEAGAACAQFIGAAEELPIDLLLLVSSEEAVEQLEIAGIVVFDGSLCRLSHPLYGEVIRRTMTATRLRRVTTSLADLIEAQGLGRLEDLIRVATWRLSSGGDETADVLNRAAHAAYRTGDFPLARQLAEAAHHRGELESSLLLAQIHHEAGDHDQAEAINVDLDLREAPIDQQTRGVVQRAVNLFFGLGRGNEALDVIEQAAAVMPYNRSWFLLNMGRIDEAGAALIGHEGDQRSYLVSRSWVEALSGAPERALGLLDTLDMQNLDLSAAPSRFRDFPDLPRTLALIESGRLADAEQLAHVGHEASIDRHPDFIRAWWLFLLGRIATDQGRLETAESYFRMGGAIQEKMQQPGLHQRFIGGAAYAGAQGHRVADAEPALEQWDSIGERDERVFAWIGAAGRAWHQGRTASAPSAIEQLIDLGDREAEFGALAAARRLWFDAVRLGGGGQVGNRLDADDSDLNRARKWATAAQVDKSGAAMAQAGELFAKIGTSLWAAEAFTAAGAFHAKEGHQRQASASWRQADLAAGRCEGVGTPGLERERSASPLTGREREVLQQAARGIPSKEIAATLFISVRTVNNLIQRSYVKLGVTSRAEAAVALGITVD